MTDKLLGLDTVPNLQVLDEDPVTPGFACYHMRPGWPPAAEIDDVILRLTETGFVDKALKEHTRKRARAAKAILNDHIAKPHP